MLTVGSLFSGVGGLELGLERAGMRTVWQVEIDSYAREILSTHWPDVRRHDDVRTFPPGDPDEWRCDLICGGFPCQDVSLAGKRAGLSGSRSGLWSEFERILRVLRPRYVLVENTPGLFAGGFGRVLGDLAALGYDAEWETLPASAAGAPHLRERIFILAHLADADGEGLAVGSCFGGDARPQLAAVERANREVGGWWGTEPGVVPMVHGISPRLVEDPIRVLGNAVVPQLSEFIGRRLIASLTG